MEPVLTVEAVQLAASGPPPVGFALAPGELLVLEAAGEPAAALLRAVLGLSRPWRGQVRVLGRDPAALSRRASEELVARLGYLPRQGELVSNLSLQANLVLPLGWHRRLTPAAAADAGRRAAARFGAPWPLPDALPADVPVALRRRVALARAVVLEPVLLLLDDFTDDLPRSDAAAVIEAVRAYAAGRGAAVLAASEDPTLADRLGARRQTLEA